MRLIDIDEVMRMTCLSRTTIYRFRREGRFPQSIQLTDSRIAWLESDVLAWIDARARGVEWRQDSASSTLLHGISDAALGKCELGDRIIQLATELCLLAKSLGEHDANA